MLRGWIQFDLVAQFVSIADKKKIYAGQGRTAAGQKRATYASAQELIALHEWDPAAYNERQQRHISLLTTQWGMSVPPANPAREAAQAIVSKMIERKSA